MAFIRTVLLVAVVAVAGVLAYNHWSGNGWTVYAPAHSTGVDLSTAGQRGAELANEAAERGHEAAVEIKDALSKGALTAKIKSKMALDDHVKARSINVDTAGSIVTLTGVVASIEERDRAIRLAKDTDGVTKVVDRLEVHVPARPSAAERR